MDSLFSYHTKEIWCRNGSHRIYGVAYLPNTSNPAPLILFAHELGNNHTSGVPYGEALAQIGCAVYTFDFCGGSIPSLENRSDGSSVGMSVCTETSDLLAILEAAQTWPFADPSKLVLWGCSQGALAAVCAAVRCPELVNRLILMYPAWSVLEHLHTRFGSPNAVPEEFGMFGHWIQVGRNYATDIWELDFQQLLSHLRQPVLLLHGDQDTTVPISYSQQASAWLPRSIFHPVPGGKHGFSDQPFQTALTQIRSFLAPLL